MEGEGHSMLIRQLREGSREAFTKLYMIYSDQLYGFVLKLTKSPADAEDILQETFLRIWNSRTQLQPDAMFKAYLFKISYHLVIDSFRKQIYAVDFESFINSEHYQKAAEDGTEQQLNMDDFRKLIAQSVSRLTPRQQEIFHLSREQELSAKEISERLGISEKTVNNQLSLILSILKADILLFLHFMLLNI